MKTQHRQHSLRRPTLAGPTVLLVLITLVPVALFAQSKKKNPSSKLYVSEVNGDAQIDTGSNVQDLNKRSVYTAEGTTIETKKADRPEDKGKAFSTMVYSNGTAAYFDENTKVEVKHFVQEPFTPNRSDMEVEPSISQTQAFVARGTVGLCASKLVAGSSMNYSTAQGSVNIRGQKVVIEANDAETKVSMLEGESTVRGGTQDLGGHTLHAGEQAIIRRGGAGQPNNVQVQKIPPAEVAALDDKVAMACMAKKTVYFDVRERPLTLGGPSGSPEAALADDTASGSATTSGGSTSTSSGLVTAFDGTPANSGFATSGSTVREIVAIPVVPVNLPVQFTVSPSRIVTPRPGG